MGISVRKVRLHSRMGGRVGHGRDVWRKNTFPTETSGGDIERFIFFLKEKHKSERLQQPMPFSLWEIKRKKVKYNLSTTTEN